MARLGRPGLSPECRQALWEMWRSGSSISEISRELMRCIKELRQIL